MHIATESTHWRSLGKTCTLPNFFYGSGPFFLPTSQVLADSHQVRLAAASIKTAMEPPSVWRKARCINAAACERTAWMGAPPALPVPGPWLPRNTTNYDSACSSFWTSWEQKDSTSAEPWSWRCTNIQTLHHKSQDPSCPAFQASASA